MIPTTYLFYGQIQIKDHKSVTLVVGVVGYKKKKEIANLSIIHGMDNIILSYMFCCCLHSENITCANSYVFFILKKTSGNDF